mmetsp:Transcript_77940/g.188223  ORF Transcript_77940/g.188223 Transcript_77940/m.188223 type:complete len:101 (-) Transcript_77940:122-424(-)
MAEADAEAKMKAKYGALPTQKDLLSKRMKGPAEKKHFDSADWAQELDSAEALPLTTAPPELAASALATKQSDGAEGGVATEGVATEGVATPPLTAEPSSS